jgi:hypothetical protein
MTPAEEQAEARLNQLSDAMQLAVCDEECQAASAMTSLIVYLYCSNLHILLHLKHLARMDR